MRRVALAALFLTACASNGNDLFKKIHVDGGADATVIPPPDANVDAAPPDAMPPDAAPTDAAVTVG